MDLRNKINISLIIGILLILPAGQLYPQTDKPYISSGDIQFYMDKAAFAGKENTSYVEFYFMFFADQITYSSSGKGELDIEIIIKKGGKTVSEREWKVDVVLNEKETGTKTKVFYDQLNEYLAPGEYAVKVSVRDQISRKKGALDVSIKIPEILKEEFNGSEIEFVSSIDLKNVSAPFQKGNKNIISNPSRRYGVLNPILYVYYEIYNIDIDKKENLDIKYSVIARDADTAKTFPQVSLERKNSTSGITHGFNVANIPSGVYNLNVHIKDTGNNSEVILSRPFEIIQKDYTDLKTNLSSEDSETFEKLLSIIGTDPQVKTYKQLSANAKASYIIEYWKSLDPSPGTAENEYLQKIQQRFVYANNKFSWQKTEGWNTERGKILIKYGMPDEIEQHESEPNTVPYEIWYYRQEKDFLFVFGDLQSNGRYILLHSSKEGEISNEQWAEYIRKL